MASAKKAAAKKAITKRAAKRTLIEPHAGDKRYVRRTPTGRFDESDDVSRSLSQDVRKTAKTAAKAGHGDKGDRVPAKKAATKAAATKKAATKKVATKKVATNAAATKKVGAKKAAARKAT